jgi:hypothetical protein
VRDGRLARVAALFVAAMLAASGAALASGAPSDPPLFEDGDDIVTAGSSVTAYDDFQTNPGGSAQAKRELRFGQDVGDAGGQLRLRVSELTRYPSGGPAFSGFGNVEIGYASVTQSAAFDRFTELRIALPTVTNGVASNDTQLKAAYGPRWKWAGGAASLVNEFDQTIVRPPGSTWTSYDDTKINLPDAGIAQAVRVSGFYEGRFVFSAGGIYRSAAGATIFGNVKNVALAVLASWGVGGNGLWRSKLEANATARF